MFSFILLVQLVFASICRSFWECGLVALDDITVTHGDCRITAGKHEVHRVALFPVLKSPAVTFSLEGPTDVDQHT